MNKESKICWIILWFTFAFPILTTLFCAINKIKNIPVSIGMYMFYGGVVLKLALYLNTFLGGNEKVEKFLTKSIYVLFFSLLIYAFVGSFIAFIL